ncbi:serine/threonine protein kinase [Myxococcota bacterium]|nr:serine/threonine protein kinase [Myxococcota bacterium]
MSHHSHGADWRSSFGGASSSYGGGASGPSAMVAPSQAWGPAPPQGLPQAQDPLLGQMIQRLQLVQKIGQGGFGAVYRAVHLDTQHSLAVKVMNLNLQGHEEAVERFRREARAMGQLNHPNVVRVQEFGFLEGYNFYYLVMEYLEGRTLQRVIKKHEPITGEWVMSAMYQLCSSLDYIHSKGIIHRDLKPGNVFLMPGPQGDIVKLLDFGIAAMAEDGSLTQSGACMGSPTYMSPEQAEGNTRHVDARADIYSLGVLAYELLTGRPPFRGDSFAALLRQHLLDPPPPLAQSCPHQSWVPQMEAVFQKVLEKTPADRYAHISAFWADFEVAFRTQLERYGYQQPTPDMTVAENLRDSLPSGLPSGQSLHDSYAQSASGRSSLPVTAALKASPVGTLALPGHKQNATPPTHRSPFLWGLVVALGVGMVILAGVVMSGLWKEDPKLLLPPPVTTGSSENSNDARVLIKSDPVAVEVWERRNYLCLTPCPLQRKPGEQLLLTLKRKGYHTKRIEVLFPMNSTNVERTFALEKLSVIVRGNVAPSLRVPVLRTRPQAPSIRRKKAWKRKAPPVRRVTPTRKAPPVVRPSKPFSEDVKIDL